MKAKKITLEDLENQDPQSFERNAFVEIDEDGLTTEERQEEWDSEDFDD